MLLLPLIVHSDLMDYVLSWGTWGDIQAWASVETYLFP